MSFVPDEELKSSGSFSLAPMIDLLFILLAVFATLAFSRIALRDTEIHLVKSKNEPASSKKPADIKYITIAVSEGGSYKWMTEIRDHSMQSSHEIAEELLRQYQRGLLPEDKKRTQVLLYVDRNAKWESILQVLLAVKDIGFDVRPVYEPKSPAIVD